jgi:hypothetical protein
VSNEQWQAYRMLPLLKSLLEADFPGIEVLPIDAFPQGNALIGSGGGHPTNSYWLQGYSPGVVGRAIDAPAAFESLLADAECDLGPR